jgi:hypothetical protein
MLRRLTADLADYYERIAVQLGPPRRDQPEPALVAVPALPGIDDPEDAEDGDGGESAQPPYYARTLWVREHLDHLGAHAADIAEPAERLAEQRRVPWWR